MKKKIKKYFTCLLVVFLTLGFMISGCNSNTINIYEAFDNKLIQMGYYFESKIDAITFFEESYQQTQNERDLVDLCKCLISYSNFSDKKIKYYQDIIELAKKSNGKLTGLSPFDLKNIYSEYAYLIYRENKEEGRNILFESADFISDKKELFDAFFFLFEDNAWDTEDYSFAYGIYKQLYSESNSLPYDIMTNNYTKQMSIVLSLYMYAKELGLQQESEEYFAKLEELIQLRAQGDFEESYCEYSFLSSNYGYHYKDSEYLNAVQFFEQEYLASKNERALADLSICISLFNARELDEYRIKYYPELFRIIDQNEYIMGLSVENLDNIYFDNIRFSYITKTNFEEELIKCSMKYIGYTRIMSRVIDFALTQNDYSDDTLLFIYNEGIKRFEQDSSQISNTETVDLINLSYKLISIGKLLGDKVDLDVLNEKSAKIYSLFEERKSDF